MRALSVHHWAGIAISYLICYVALDWVSFIEPLGRFNITPWNPPAGLSIVLLLVAGLRFAPFLMIAPLLADAIVRGLPTPLPVAIVLSVMIGAIYATATYHLAQPRWRFDARLGSLRDVLLLLLMGGLSSMLVAGCYAGVLASAGLLASTRLISAVLKYWVGDFIGIVVTTPLLVLLFARRLSKPSVESASRYVAIIVALAVIIVLPDAAPLQLFYILFLPVIWSALSEGFEETSVAIVVTQLGLIAALQLSHAGTSPVLSYQLLMLVLANTGLITGAVVSDRRRAEHRLRSLQDAQARFNRLGSMGALAAALTHEINQPLSAAGTYSRLALEALPEEDAKLDNARTHSRNAVAQIQRAAGIMRRVRDLIMIGRSELEPVAPDSLIRDTIRLLQPELQRSGCSLSLNLDKDLPLVLADTQQVGQVIINLVHNAVEAMSSGASRHCDLAIAAQRREGAVAIEVRDRGPGFDPEQLAAPIMALASSKPNGLGVGLALSKMIVENHGGKLELENTKTGGLVRFTLREAQLGRQGQDPG